MPAFFGSLDRFVNRASAFATAKQVIELSYVNKSHCSSAITTRGHVTVNTGSHLDIAQSVVKVKGQKYLLRLLHHESFTAAATASSAATTV